MSTSSHYTLLIFTVFSLSTGCVDAEVCPNSWMTFFVNETQLTEGNFSGKVCAQGASCRSMPTLWAPCKPDSPHPLCGPASAWLCLGEGNFTFTISDDDQGGATVMEGAFTMPPAQEAGCRARVHVGTETRVEPQTCIPDQPMDAFSPALDADIHVTD